MSSSPRTLRPEQVEVGSLLAEGGEGQVFEVRALSDAADVAGLAGARLVYKRLRRARPWAGVGALAAYLPALEGAAPGLAARARAASAWPLAVVGEEGDEVVGFVCPRAPDRFWVKHRDGGLRLGVLSYLSADPDRVAISYGVDVPPPGSAPRVGLVYALARLVDAWQSPAAAGGVGVPGPVVHGDLSSKNVLWSVEPVPQIFVLDCDGAVVAGGEGAAHGEAEREDAPGASRPATPNWDDPARRFGEPPGLATDRYSLGLVFLRVLGAAHFPLQGRQRQGGLVEIDLELPRSWRRLADMPGLWALCEASLSMAAVGERPAPGAWAYAMRELLGALGAPDLAAAIRQAQGDPQPDVAPSAVPPPKVPDVTVRPVLRHRAPSTWQLVHTGPALAPGAGTRGAPPGVPASAAGGGPGGLVGATLRISIGGTSSPGTVGGLFGMPPGSPPRAMVRAGWATFRAAHRLVGRLLRSPGRRLHGLRRLVGVALFDLAAAVLALFLVGMIVSPWIGL